eukprot:1160049-Pelagomonas_calceolata.AAC.1
MPHTRCLARSWATASTTPKRVGPGRAGNQVEWIKASTSTRISALCESERIKPLAQKLEGKGRKRRWSGSRPPPVPASQPCVRVSGLNLKQKIGGERKEKKVEWIKASTSTRISALCESKWIRPLAQELEGKEEKEGGVDQGLHE